MHTLLVDAISDGGSQSFTLLLWGALLGMSGFVAFLMKQERADSREREAAANKRAEDAAAAGIAAVKQERDRADQREQGWLAKLDKVASAQEELDDNVSNIHLLIDGLLRTIRERDGLPPPTKPSPPVARRRTQGGE